MGEMVQPVTSHRSNPAPARLRLQVRGVVQGVGFRPFVHHIATQHGLNGYVCNDSAGVEIEVEGNADALEAFQHDLAHQAPPMAHIEHIMATPVSLSGARGFAIVHSHHTQSAYSLASPDVAFCDDCLAELFDPNNRRFRYPFINCTNCGPRYTIIHDLPYDRPATTMAMFELCPECRREYEDPTDRRFHAQPTACPKCGPQLTFRWLQMEVASTCARLAFKATPEAQGDDAIQQTQTTLSVGGIVAIKGIGGFHLACDATNAQAVTTLRQRKQRGDKPFAIMARDLAAVLQIAHAGAEEIALLTSRERPIVLLKKRANSRVSELVAPGNRDIGVMLPYAPLHYLLFAPSPAPDTLEPAPWLVMTSGNRADEPIVIDNKEAMTDLAGLADAILLHDRPIHVPCDDSVVRVVEGKAQPLRRSRGYAPLPVHLPIALPPALATGGEIKNAFCLAQGRHAFMSQHIGDMENFGTQESFRRSVTHMQKLFRIQPEVIACDLHPGYHASRLAAEIAESSGGTRLVKVQHHHAHIAALMAEQGLSGQEPVIGFCFDGTGYGTDGAIWGGEVLVADYHDFERISHLAYLPLPGGDAAVHKPYRMALAALWATGEPWDDCLPPVQSTTATELSILRRQLEIGLNCVSTSSMGRLFDIVAALCGVRQVATYEAQAAIELEAQAARVHDAYHFAWSHESPSTFDASPVVHDVVHDVLNNIPKAIIAGRFHNAVADIILDISIWARAQSHLNQVALSGGVFQNATLLQGTVKRLQHAGFETLIHRAVPANDGGLALGQLLVAAHKE